MSDRLIENVALAREVAHDIEARNVRWWVKVIVFFLDHGTGLVIGNQKDYVFDEDCASNEDERTRLVTDLFDFSMKWRILKSFRRAKELNPRDDGYSADDYIVLSYRIFLEESTDGQTNITPDIVDALSGFFKKGGR